MSRMLNDFLAAELGDKRLTSRLMVIAAAIAAAPDESLPQRFLDPSELEAAYRFFSRSHTGYDVILAAHAAGTVERSIPAGQVLVLHDTTDFAFVDSGSPRQHLSQVSKNRQGFYAHYSLVVADDESNMPLGTLSMIPYVHRSQVESDTAAWWDERGGLFTNEQARWFQGCETSETALRTGHVDAIHVCDREGDAYELLSQLVAHDMRFVIRCAQRSRTVCDEAAQWRPLDECLAAAPASVEERTITVPIEKLTERRKGDNAKSGQQSARPRRKATVRTRWTKVRVRRPQDLARHPGIPGMIDVFVVEVFEVAPPAGIVAASWILYTSESVNDETEAWQTVDRYRKRWLIEEFFKAIKTGVAYEKRQLTTAHGLLNMLAVTTLIASDILVMRACERVASDLEAEWLFEPDMIVLAQRLNPKQKFSPRPTMAEMLQAVAKLGGHIKQNGSPGWIVLYRGYVKLLEALYVVKQLGAPLIAWPAT